MLAVSYCSGQLGLHDFLRGVIWQFEIVDASHDTWQGQIWIVVITGVFAGLSHNCQRWVEHSKA